MLSNLREAHLNLCLVI